MKTVALLRAGRIVCAALTIVAAVMATAEAQGPGTNPPSKETSVSKPASKVGSSARNASLSSRSFDESQYKKANELSVRPSPIDEIRVPSPEKAPATGIVTTKVTLFVDEKGVVRNIAFDETALDQPFRDAVQTAFAKARFKPGRVGDKPVKARMRIEVTFEPNKADKRAGAGPSGASAQR